MHSGPQNVNVQLCIDQSEQLKQNIRDHCNLSQFQPICLFISRATLKCSAVTLYAVHVVTGQNSVLIYMTEWPLGTAFKGS